MIDKRLLQKFIQGLASDEEASVCEDFLKDCDLSTIESVLILQAEEETLDDTLVASLKATAASGAEPQLDACRQATEHISASIQRCLESSDVARFLRPAEADDEIGRMGPYRILERTGSGGMGIVFRAQPIPDGIGANQDAMDTVALKLMNPMMASNPQTAERFQREVRSAAKLDHPRIVRILDVGTDHGLPFFTMDFLKGQSLRQRLDECHKLSPRESTSIALQIAEGLEFANSHGILHRDIKPDNLWLDESGNVVILDFGLARGNDDTAGLTNTGDVLGTPRYMAPEQVKGQAVDHRTDLFSLGCVLYEMLTGRSTFEKANVYSTMMAVTQDNVAVEELTETGCPRPLAELTCRLLEKNPDHRPESATILIQELKDMARSEAAMSIADPATPISRWPRFLKGGLAASLLIALSIVIYLQTDKGTLVIQAGEGVEISTGDQTVAVRLVNSNQVFNVSVGENRLPTGAYEVVVETEPGITLSSERFVIRRGEKEVVDVTLQQPGPTAGVNRQNLQYARIAEWFRTSKHQSDPQDAIQIALGEITLIVNRQIVFKMNASFDQKNGERRVTPTRFYDSLDEYFGKQVEIVRGGKSLGTATIVNSLPEKNGDSRPDQPLVAMLDADTIRRRVVPQAEDVVVLVQNVNEMTSTNSTMIETPFPEDSIPAPRPNDKRKFLKEKFPDVVHCYVGNVSEIAGKTSRISIDAFFDLTVERPRMGEEYLANHEWEVPAMAGQVVHFFRGNEKVATGRVLDVLGNHDKRVVQIEEGWVSRSPYETSQGAVWEPLLRGTLVVIPVNDEQLFPIKE